MEFAVSKVEGLHPMRILHVVDGKGGNLHTFCYTSFLPKPILEAQEEHSFAKSL